MRSRIMYIEDKSSGLSEPAVAMLALCLVGLAGCGGDVSRDPRLRGGYAAGQSLRLRVDAFAFTYDAADHPAERGLQVTAAQELRAAGPEATREWERRNRARVVSRLPAGTRFRLERVDLVTTSDTATLVPRAVIADGPGRGRQVSLSGVSSGVPGATEYPYPRMPDPGVLEVVSPRAP
jgi:hypothetical protein